MIVGLRARGGAIRTSEVINVYLVYKSHCL